MNVALELAPGQSDGAVAGASSSGSGESTAGTLPEEALVREIVTNAITNQSGETLISREWPREGPARDPRRRQEADRSKSRTGAVPRSDGPIGRAVAETIEYEQFEDSSPQGAAGDGDLSRLSDVPMELSVEIGRTHMTVGEALDLHPGSVVTLERFSGEPADLLVNGTPIARGEVVVVDEQFGLRVTEILDRGPAAEPAAVDKRAGGQGRAPAGGGRAAGGRRRAPGVSEGWP